MKTINLKSLTIALALLISMNVGAQNFHYGVKAGANFAVQSEIASYFENDNIRTGLSVGAFGNYDINDWFSVQAEANYDQKGAKSESIVIKYDYLTVPVLAKFSLGKSDKTKLKFNVNVGPYAGFLLGAEADVDDNTIDLKDNTEDIEFGVIAGFGMKYPVAKNNIILDLRMGLGLNSYDKVDTDLSNKYIGLTLGYEF